MIKQFLNQFIFRFFFYNNKKNRLKKNIIRTFKLNDFIVDYINKMVSYYYNGKHPKHYLWKSHYKFIIDNINSNEKVLDIGCGTSLSYIEDLSQKVDFIEGIDINREKIQFCISKNKFNNVHFSVMDITKELPLKRYDVIILSHILEHLDNPEDVLKKIKATANKIIVRLPRYDDHWMNLVKKDLGVNYFKDSVHKQEFTLKTAKDLINKSGWKIKKCLQDIDIKIVASHNL